MGLRMQLHTTQFDRPWRGGDISIAAVRTVTGRPGIKISSGFLTGADGLNSAVLAVTGGDGAGVSRTRVIVTKDFSF